MQPGLHVLRVDTADVARPAARLLVRAALCEFIGARLGMDPAEVAIRAVPGEAPRLLLGGQLARQGISVTHAGPFALAAFHEHGAVGIDVMQVQEVPDWDRVALDYLGPEVHAKLAGLGPARRAEAFAQAWTRREAQLKCLGLPLAEFAPLPANCSLHILPLPPGYAGTLATQSLTACRSAVWRRPTPPPPAPVR
jgi:4'-phosphopantetheinyl transferase